MTIKFMFSTAGMTRYFLFTFLLLNSLPLLGEEEGMQGAVIGSIEDSGRVDPDEFQFSNTENKLWMDDHLSNIERKAKLYYQFEKTGSYEESFTDDVYLSIVTLHEDGTKDATLDFFTEERRQAVSSDNVNGISGNPVIGEYMQGDVYEMNRLTGGNWRYFQREIKLAMADSNESTAVTVELSGEQYRGEKIVLRPFDSDKNQNRLGEFADKSYEFILSDEIPGKLYQIKTVINDAKRPEEPLIEEVLTLKSVEYTP